MKGLSSECLNFTCCLRAEAFGQVMSQNWHFTLLTTREKSEKKNTVSIFNHYFENWYIGFPLLWYTRISKFQFDQGYVRQRTINCTCYGNYRIITCFYLLRYFCYIPWCRMWSRNMRSEPQCFKQCEHWKLSSSRKRKQYSIMSS